MENIEDHTQTNFVKLGQFVAEAMERMETQLPQGVKLGEIMMVCEFQGKDDEGDYTTLRFTCSDPREFVQLGLLKTAELIVSGNRAS